MRNEVSFEGIGGDIATFYAEPGVQPGYVVKLSANATVAPCEAGDRFCAVAHNVRGDVSAVQFGGFAQLLCTDEAVRPGYVALTADGAGGVKKAPTAPEGVEYLVVSRDGAAAVTVRL